MAFYEKTITKSLDQHMMERGKSYTVNDYTESFGDTETKTYVMENTNGSHDPEHEATYIIVHNVSVSASGGVTIELVKNVNPGSGGTSLDVNNLHAGFTNATDADLKVGQSYTGGESFGKTYNAAGDKGKGGGGIKNNTIIIGPNDALGIEVSNASSTDQNLSVSIHWSRVPRTLMARGQPDA